MRLIAEGHRKVADGWTILEGLMEETEAGSLPGLLRGMAMATGRTPTPTPTPSPTPSTSQDVKPADMGLEMKPVNIERPVSICVSRDPWRYNYGCPQCAEPPKSSFNGMDAHIRAVHTKVALLCAFCNFSTYNRDSLLRHEKKDCPSVTKFQKK